MINNQIDEYWLFINPLIFGNRITLFSNINDRINLRMIISKEFSCGVI